MEWFVGRFRSIPEPAGKSTPETPEPLVMRPELQYNSRLVFGV